MPPLAKTFVAAAFLAGGVFTFPTPAQSTDAGSTTVVLAARDSSAGVSAGRETGTRTKYGTGVRTARGARFWPGGGGEGVVDVTADAAEGGRSRFRTQAGGTPQSGGEGGDFATGDEVGVVQDGAAGAEGAQGSGAAGSVGGAPAVGEGGQAGQSTFTPIDFGSPTYVPGGFDGGGPVPVNSGAFTPNTTGRTATVAPAAPQSVYVERSYTAPAYAGPGYAGPGAVVVPAVPFDNRSTTGRTDTGIRNPVSRRRTSTFGGRGPKPQAEAFGNERGNGVYIDPSAVILRNGPPLEGTGSASNLFEGSANP